MVYAAEFRGAFTSAARRDAVRADIEARIAARPRWSIDLIASADLSGDLAGGANGLTFSIRFLSRADQDDLVARIQAFATGVRAPIAGSTLTVHDCPHDEDPPSPCAAVAARVW